MFDRFTRDNSRGVGRVGTTRARSHVSACSASLTGAVSGAISTLARKIAVPTRSLLVKAGKLTTTRFLARTKEGVTRISSRVDELERRNSGRSTGRLRGGGFTVTGFTNNVRSVMREFDPARKFSNASFKGKFAGDFSSVVFKAVTRNNRRIVTGALRTNDSLTFKIVSRSKFLRTVGGDGRTFLLKVMKTIPTGTIHISLGTFRGTMEGETLTGRRHSNVPSAPSRMASVLNHRFASLGRSPSAPAADSTRGVGSIARGSTRGRRRVHAGETNTAVPGFSASSECAIKHEMERRKRMDPPAASGAAVNGAVAEIGSNSICISKRLSQRSIARAPAISATMGTMNPAPRRVRRSAGGAKRLRTSSSILRSSRKGPKSSRRMSSIGIIPSCKAARSLEIVKRLCASRRRREVRRLKKPRGIAILINMGAPRRSRGPSISRKEVVCACSGSPSFRFRRSSRLNSVERGLGSPTFPVDRLSVRRHTGVTRSLQLKKLLPSTRTTEGKTIINSEAKETRFVQTSILLGVIRGKRISPGGSFLC